MARPTVRLGRRSVLTFGRADVAQRNETHPGGARESKHALGRTAVTARIAGVIRVIAVKSMIRLVR